jgi:hypothetical protein
MNTGNTLDMRRHGWLVGVGVVLLLIGFVAWRSDGGDGSLGPSTYGAPDPASSYTMPGYTPRESDDWTHPVEPYTGLSEDEKDAIWRQALPTWTYEERKEARKELEP